MLIMLIVAIPVLFVTTALQYVGGRILAPEFGLSVPDFWAWFWFSVLVLLPIGVISAVYKELSD